MQVLLAVSIMHVTLGTAYYFSAVKPQYIGLLQAHRQQPVFDRCAALSAVE